MGTAPTPFPHCPLGPAHRAHLSKRPPALFGKFWSGQLRTLLMMSSRWNVNNVALLIAGESPESAGTLNSFLQLHPTVTLTAELWGTWWEQPGARAVSHPSRKAPSSSLWCGDYLCKPSAGGGVA